MYDQYKQELKEFAKTFKTLNIQLLGFLLVAIGFIFTSDTIMNNPHLSSTTMGFALTFFLWVFSLISFLAAEFPQKSLLVLFKSVKEGRWLFGFGLVSLTWSIIYLTSYVANVLQDDTPTILSIVYSVGWALMITIFVWRSYYNEIKIPYPPEDSEDMSTAEEEPDRPTQNLNKKGE